jgi:tetratricopeptide (TPR) repeat protein
MALDKNKLAAEATKHVQRGQWDKAIKLYEKILAGDPKDVRVLLKVGELQQKKGDAPAAAETLRAVAQAYSDQGFFLKAVAVNKQIAKLTPGDARVHENLAGLYQQLGIVSDAMAQLQLVVQAAEAAGDEKRLFAVLGRMLELDPENPGAATRLGELHANAGATAAALEQFRRAAEVLKRSNRNDEYLRVAERIVALDAKDSALTRELANAYLRRGDTKRALAKLQQCFKDDPHDVETLGLLANAFRDLGQLSKTVSVYKELARIEGEHGHVHEARSAWQRVLEIAPHDAEALEGLEALGAAGARPAPTPTAAPAPATPAPVATPRPAVRPPAEAVPKLLQETEVFAKYGLYKKALEHLDKVFAADANHLGARERARDLTASAGNAAAAAEHGARAVQIALDAGDFARASSALARLVEVAPQDPRIAALRQSLAAAEAAAPEAAPGAEVVLELDAAEAGLDEVSFSDESLDRVVVAPAAPPADDAGAELDDVAFSPAVSDDDALELPPPDPASPPPPEDLGAAIADDVVAATAFADGVQAAAAEPGGARDADLQAELEEIDFLVQQGLLEDAREMIATLLPLYPTHGGLLAREAEVRRAGPRPMPVAAADDGTFDLGAELAADLAEDPPDLPDLPASPDLSYRAQDAFEAFKKGVERTITAEDGETHYDLAVAYREMGLFADAIHEFEIAMSGRPPRNPVDCLTMIGLCRMDGGEPAGAVDAYRRALATGDVPSEAARTLHYELSRALLELGDEQGALWYLQKVLRADPRFRDARAIAARLGDGPGRPPPGDPDAVPEAPRRSARDIGFV